MPSTAITEMGTWSTSVETTLAFSRVHLPRAIGIAFTEGRFTYYA